MPLILAVDRDRSQSKQLASLVHKRLKTELVQATSAAEALEALAGRVPDLILTSSLISPKEDGVLSGHLRELGDRAAHVQTLTIPVLKTSRPRRSKSGVLSKLRREEAKPSSGPDGCEPEVFAEEISLYLARAAEEQKMRADRETTAAAQTVADEPPPSLVDVAEFVEEPEAVIEASVDTEAGVDTDSSEEVADPVILAQEETIEAAPQEPEPELVLEEASPVVARAPVPDTTLPEVTLAEVTLPEATLAEVTLSEATPLENRLEATDTAVPKDEPALEVPIDRLVALFADFEPGPDETPIVMAADVPEPEALAVAAEPVESIESIAAASTVSEIAALPPVTITPPVTIKPPVTVTPPANVASPAPTPAREEKAPAHIEEAAWKARFRATFLKELGIGAKAEASASTPAAETKRTVQPKRQKAAVEAVAETTVEAVAETTVEAAVETSAETAAETETAAEATPDVADQGQASRKENRSKKKPKGKTKGPAQDEWGLFDPDQCGFSALVDKLDEVTDAPEEQPQRSTRSRVISY